MTMGDLFIFCSLQFLFSMVCSFPYRGLSLLFYFIIYLFIQLLCWVGVDCGIYKDCINMSNISYWFHPLHYFSLPHPPLFQHVYFFLFTLMCTQYLHHVHPLTPFLHSLPISTGVNTPKAGPVTTSILWFCIRKKK
jgi:hypothetical protein